MRITLTEAEIKEAVSEKVLSQMSINENMDLQVDLSATRGADGFTATIDVVAKATEAPLEIAPKVARARRTAAQIAIDNATEAAATDTKVEEPAEGPAVEAAEGDSPPAEPPVTTEENTPPPAASKGSIFANLNKPVNTPKE